MSSFSDSALRETLNDGDNIGGGCGKGSDGSESVPCPPTSSCTGGTMSNSSSSANGGVDNLLHGSKVGQNNRVEGGGLELEASTAASSSTSGDKTIPQADAAATAALFNLQVSESTDQSERVDIVSLPPSQEGSAPTNVCTTGRSKSTTLFLLSLSPPAITLR